MVEEGRSDILYEGDDDESPGDELSSLKSELAEQTARAEANLAGWQRAQADFVNYRRRSEQEREDQVKYANANLMLRILPVLDDFERALASLPRELSDDPWVKGVKHIERKFRSVLESAGLSAIEALGLPFDPRLHEAVRQDNGEEGIVIGEAEKGYKLLDRVIRPSKVVVGIGGGDRSEEPAAP